MTRCLLLLAVLPGCMTVSRPTCSTEEVEVSDDDALGDLSFTVAEMVGSMEGDHTAELIDASGGLHPSTIRATRGEGPAVFVDATAGVETSRRLGFGQEQLTIFVECDDEVNVPMVLEVLADDLAVTITGEAVAWNDVFDPPLFTVSHTLDADDVLPPVSTTHTDQATAEVQFQGGALASVSAWWDEPYTQAVSWP